MSERLKHSRLFTVPGLAVMVVPGMYAARYTPDWFDVSETCLRRRPCFSEAESASALQTLGGVVFAGLVLTLVGIALRVGALRSAPRRGPSGSRPAVHAGLSGVSAGLAAISGLFASFIALIGGSNELAIAVITIMWLVFAGVLEDLDQAFGRKRGAAEAYLLSLGAGLVGVVVLGVTLTVLGFSWMVLCLVLAILSVVIVTAFADISPQRQVQPWAAGAAITVMLLTVVPAAAVSLRLLAPHKALAPGTFSSAGSPEEPPASDSLVPDAPSTANPTPTPTRAIARRACKPSDLTLSVGGFDFSLGRRSAWLVASNGSSSACYLDGFATATLLQGGRVMNLTIGTTSSDMPGLASHGQSTRVGLGPGDSARAALFWLGYGVAADTKTPQTLNVVLRPGAAMVPVTVPLPRFELIDGGQLRVGNWLSNSGTVTWSW